MAEEPSKLFVFEPTVIFTPDDNLSAVSADPEVAALPLYCAAVNPKPELILLPI